MTCYNVIHSFVTTNIQCTKYSTDYCSTHTGPLAPIAINLYKSFTKSFFVKFGGVKRDVSGLQVNESACKKHPSPLIIFILYGRAGGSCTSCGLYGTCLLWLLGSRPKHTKITRSMIIVPSYKW